MIRNCRAKSQHVQNIKMVVKIRLGRQWVLGKVTELTPNIRHNL